MAFFKVAFLSGLLALSLLLVACRKDLPPSPAPDSGVPEVLQRLGDLERRIEQVEKRLAALPATAPQTLPPAPQSSRAPGSAPATPSGLGPKEAAKVDRIAFVGNDGNLYTVRPDGSDRVQLTGPSGGAPQGPPERFAFWPTWAHNGRMLAFSEARRAAGGTELSVTLMAVDTSTGQLQTLYKNPPAVLPVIAPGTPHYMSWSPDGSQLAFLAAEAEGLVLRVSTLNTDGEPPKLAQGAPLYHAWSPDGRSLLLHTGEETSVTRGPTFTDPLLLEGGSLAFRTPAWSPDGRHILRVAGTSGGENTLQTTNSAGGGAQPLTPVGGQAAFLWSPTGERVAFVDAPDPAHPFYTRLGLVSSSGGPITTLAEEPIVAFFWSPDGRRIAYVAINRETPGRLTWKIVEPGVTPPRKLADFVPGDLFEILLAFFDQYAYSHSLWSPDSTRILFTGHVSGGDGSGNGAAPTSDTIYTVNVVGEPVVVPIARGPMAAWSWR